MSSPSLSAISRSTEMRTSSSVSTSTNLNFNYEELFEDIDWGKVNLIDIEREWRDELDQIEKVKTQKGSLLIFFRIMFKL